MIFGCVYEGNFSKNTRKGQGKMTYSTGEVYEGEWIDDVQSTFSSPPPPPQKTIESSQCEHYRVK